MKKRNIVPSGINGKFYLLFMNGSIYASKKKKELIAYSGHDFDREGCSTTANDVWIEKQKSSEIDEDDFWDEISIIK
jgi:hypothetical protein